MKSGPDVMNFTDVLLEIYRARRALPGRNNVVPWSLQGAGQMTASRRESGTTKCYLMEVADFYHTLFRIYREWYPRDIVLIPKEYPGVPETPSECKYKPKYMLRVSSFPEFASKARAIPEVMDLCGIEVSTPLTENVLHTDIYRGGRNLREWNTLLGYVTNEYRYIIGILERIRRHCLRGPRAGIALPGIAVPGTFLRYAHEDGVKVALANLESAGLIALATDRTSFFPLVDFTGLPRSVFYWAYKWGNVGYLAAIADYPAGAAEECPVFGNSFGWKYRICIGDQTEISYDTNTAFIGDTLTEEHVRMLLDIFVSLPPGGVHAVGFCRLLALLPIDPDIRTRAVERLERFLVDHVADRHVAYDY